MSSAGRPVRFVTSMGNEDLLRPFGVATLANTYWFMNVHMDLPNEVARIRDGVARADLILVSLYDGSGKVEPAVLECVGPLLRDEDLVFHGQYYAFYDRGKAGRP